MSAIFPTSIVTFTTKTNKVDLVDASHVNRLQEEVIALQQYVGTYPQGSKNTLTERLALLIATNGAIVQGVAFPSNAVEGQLFWRTDLFTAYAYSTSSGQWVALGNSLSNVVFQFGGQAGTACAAFFSTGLTPSFVGTNPRLIWGANGVAGLVGTAFETRLRKIAGMQSITVHYHGWTSGAGTGSFSIRTIIGAVKGSASIGISDTVPAWTSYTMDISGLNNGTVYNVVIETNANGSTNGYFDSLIGISS